jgi:predicted acyltransferase (DUF342 family)
MSVQGNPSKNLLNVPPTVNLGIDVVTRSPYMSTYVGYQVAQVSTGFFNCFYGFTAAAKNQKGRTNMYFGTYCAENATNGSLNTVFGNYASRYLLTGSCNTMIGNYAGQHNDGFNNIFIGQNNNGDSNTSSTTNIIGIGNDLVSAGLYNVVLGYSDTTSGRYNLSIGNSIVQNTKNSLVIGQNINNYGSNSIILKNNHFASNASFTNYHDNYLNINDTLFTTFNSSNDRQYVNLSGDLINIQGSHTGISLEDDRVHLTGVISDIVLGDVIALNSKYSHLVLDQSVYISAASSNTGSSNYIFLSSNLFDIKNDVGELLIASNVTRLSGPHSKIELNGVLGLYGQYGTLVINSNNTIAIQNSNSAINMGSNLSFTTAFAGLYLNSNNVYLVGSNANTIGIYGSNSSILMNTSAITLNGPNSVLNLGSNTVDLIGKSGYITINSNAISIVGSNSSFIMDQSNVNIKAPTSELLMGSNSVQLIASNADLLSFIGKAGQFIIDSNGINIQNSNSQLLLSSNSASLIASNADLISIIGKSGQFTIDPTSINISSGSNSGIVLNNDSINIFGSNASSISIVNSNTNILFGSNIVSFDAPSASIFDINAQYGGLTINSNNTSLHNNTCNISIDLGSNINFYGNGYFDSNLFVAGTLYTNRIVTTNNNTITIDAPLNTHNISTFNSNITVNANSTFNGYADFTQTVHFGSNVIIDGIANLSNILNAYANSYFWSNVTIAGALKVDKLITGSGSNESTVSLDLNSIKYFNSNVTFCNSIYVNSNIYANNVYAKDQYISFNDTVIFNSNVIFNGSSFQELSVNTISSTHSNILITSPVVFSSNVNIDGFLSVNGFKSTSSNPINFDTAVALSNILNAYSNASFQGPITASNTFQVNGSASFLSNVNIYGPLTINNYTTLSNDLNVTGNTTLSNVNVTGTLNVSSNLVVSGISQFLSNLLVQGQTWFASNVTMSNSLDILGNANITSNLNVQGPTLLQSNLLVQGSTWFASNVTMSNSLDILGNANITSNLNVQGPTLLQSNLLVQGQTWFASNVTMSNSLDILGNANITSNLNVQGPTLLQSNLLVQGQTWFASNVTMSNALNILGNTWFASNVTMSNSLDIIGNANITSNLNVQGPVVFQSNLLVQGQTWFASNVTMSNALNILGNTYLTSNLNVQGPVVFQSNLLVQGQTWFASNVTMSNNLDILGNTYLTSNLNVQGPVVFQSNLLVQKETWLNSNVTLSNSLGVLGNTYLTSNLSVQGPTLLQSNLVVQNETWLNSNVTLSNDLLVLGDTILQNNLYVDQHLIVNNDATFYSNVDIQDNLIVNNNTYIGEKLVVGSDAYFSSNVIIEGNLTVRASNLITFCNITQTFAQAFFLSNIDIYGYANIQADVYIDNTLIVNKATTLSNELNTLGNVYFTSNLNVQGPVVFQSNLLVQKETWLNSNVTLSNGLHVLGNTYLTSNFNVQGPVVFQSNLLVQKETWLNSNVTLSNGLHVLGNTYLTSNFNVQGPVVFQSNLLVQNKVWFESNVTLSNELSVLGNTYLTSNFNVLGPVVFQSNLLVQNKTWFESNVTLSNELFVLGNTYLTSNFNVLGPVVFQSNLLVQNKAWFESNVTLSNELFVLGNTYLTSNFNVLGPVVFQSNLLVQNKAWFESNVTLSNELSVLGNVYFTSNLNVLGPVVFQSNLLVQNKAWFESNVTLSNELNTIGNVYFTSNLNVLGPVTFQSNLLVQNETWLNSNVIMSNNLITLGDVKFASNLDVYGDVRFHGSNFIVDRSCMSVFDGTVSFSNPIHINSNVYFNDGAYIENRTYLTMSNDYIIYNSGIGEIISDQQTSLTDLVVNGNVTFCNNAYVNGVVIFGTSNSNLVAYSNFEGTVADEITGTLIVDENLYVGGRLFVNGFRMTSIESISATLEDLNVYGSMSLCNAFVQGQLVIGSSSNHDYIVYSNISDPNYSEFDTSVVVDSNLYVGGKIFCNGFSMTAIDSYTVNDIVVMGTMTLCNTDVYGVVRFGPNSNNYHAFSNIHETNYTSFDSSVQVTSNLYVDGIIYCNGFSMTAMESYLIHDAIITGTMTLCNTAIEGIVSFGTTSNNYITWSNIPEPLYTELDSSLVVDSNLYVGGRIFCNGFSMTSYETYIIHDATIYGTMTLCNTDITGVVRFGASNNDYAAFSNIHDSNLAEFDGSVMIDSNLYVSGRIYCNGFAMTALESYVINDAIITGTMTLCNTAIQGIVSFGATSNEYTVWSNVKEPLYTEFDSSLVVDSNLYVGGRIFCNGFSMTAIESYTMHDAIITGTMTLCNTAIEGIVSFGATSNEYTVWSNVKEPLYTEFDSSLVVDSNLYVGGRIFCNGFSMTAIESYTMHDAIVTGTMTLCNTHVEGVITFGATSNHNRAFSNIKEPLYSSFESSVLINSNLYIDGMIFCNGFSMTAIESYVINDAIITGTMTLCNTAVEGIISFGATSNEYTVWKNIKEPLYTEFDSSLVVDSNLYVGGRIFCNGFSMTAIESYTINDAIITGTMTLCNTAIEGIVSFGATSNEYTVWKNIKEPLYTEFDSSLVVDSNLYVGGRIFCNGFSMTAIESYTMNDAIITGTMTLCNTHVEGVVTFGATSNHNRAFSNIKEPLYTSFDSSVLINSNLYIDGMIFCNGFSMTAIESYVMNDAIVTGTMTLCNAHVEGVVTFGSTSNHNRAFSNIQEPLYTSFDSSVLITSNLYIDGMIFCNGFSMTAIESYVLNDAIITGTMTLCNTHVEGAITFGGTNYVDFSNYIGSNINVNIGSQLIDENLYVRGKIYCSGFEYSAVNIFNGVYDTLTVNNTAVFNSDIQVVDTINLMYNSNISHWNIGLNIGNSNFSDLVFKSINGTQVVFTDDFTSSILNFTAKHHCTLNKKKKKNLQNDLIGQIVISTGKYQNLDNTHKICIDDAVPIVKLSHIKNDPRVFGVISGFEENNKERNFKLGNLKFTQKKEKKDIKVIVNSAGEGAIWITNINGNIKNGDLISSSEISGLGMKQDDHIVYNYTVAKATCSCNFNLKSKKYKCQEFDFNGITYKKAFIGCVYKF